MRLVRQPHINTAPLEEHRASNALWLVGLLAWIADVLERYAPQIARCPLLRAAAAAGKAIVTRDLRDGLRVLRTIVVAHAIARMRFTGRRWQKRFAGSARGHALRARHGARLCRRATAHVLRDMHRGSLRQRAARLAACFNNIESLAARALKRLNAMHRTPRTLRHALVVTHDACASLVGAHPIAPADTS